MRHLLALSLLAFFSLNLASAQETSTIEFRTDSRGSWHENTNWSRRYVPTARVVNEEAFVGFGEAIVERLAPEVLNLGVKHAVVSIEPNGILPVRHDVTVQRGGRLHIAGELTANTLLSEGTVSVVQGQALDLRIAGEVTLGGVFQVLGGNAPEIGEGIELFSVSNFTNLGATIELPGAFDPAFSYQLRHDGEMVSVVAAGVPHVVISRATGRTLFRHTAGDDPVAITGYTLKSLSGQLLPDNWQTIGQSANGWTTANPTPNALSELTLNEPYRFDVGTELDLGTATTSGREDVALRYSEVSGVVTTSNVAYVGVPNDIVLQIDPATGNASMRFLSTSVAPPEITGYKIATSNGSLRPTDWTSPDAAGAWDRTIATTSSIAESLATGALVFETDSEFSLGPVFDSAIASATQHGIDFTVTTTDGQVLDGTVSFVDPLAAIPEFDCNRDTMIDFYDANCTTTGDLSAFLNASGMLPADADGSQSVDFADFLILSKNFGQDGVFTDGDFDRSGRVDFADFLILSETFGDSAASPPPAGEPVAVPEPAGWIMLLALLPLLHVIRCKKHLMLFVVLAMVSFNTEHAAAAEKFVVRLLDIEPTDSSGQILSVERAKQLLANPTDNATIKHDIPSTIAELDVGSSNGRFPGVNPYPVEVYSDFIYRAVANINIPEGDWTLSFGSDDGGYLNMSGVEFLTTSGEDGPIIEGDGEIVASRPRPQGWTSGTFRVPEGGQSVWLDAAFYERSFVDVLEVAITPGHIDSRPSPGVDSWEILQDGTHGWDILPFSGRFDFSGNGTVDFADFLILANNFEQYGEVPQGDSNNDGYVDLVDFAGFREAYLQETQMVEAANVPEPSSTWLLLVSAALLLVGSRAKKHGAFSSGPGWDSSYRRGSDRNAAGRYALTLILMAGMIGYFADTSYAQTESRWLEASGGRWASDNNWSTDDSPNDRTRDAIIDVVDGEPYRILAREHVSVGKLRLLSPDATLSISDWFVTHDGIELDGGTIRIGGDWARLALWGDSQSITGNGLIQASGHAVLDVASTEEFTLGEGIVFETNGGEWETRILGGLINEGTLRVHRSDRLRVEPHEFANRGMIDVGGSIEISLSISDGNRRLWENEGSIVLRRASFFNMYGGDMTLAGLGNFVNDDAEVARIHGFLVNEGEVLDLASLPDQIGNLTFAGIKGGRLVAAPGAPSLSSLFHRSGFDSDGRLHGATLQGQFEVNQGTLSIEDSLTLDNAKVLLAETASIDFFHDENSQRLDGTGEILVTSSDNSGRGRIGGGGNLVIGPGITIRTDRNDPPRAMQLEATRFEGLIHIDSDTRVSIPSANWTNAGEINVSAGTLVVGTLDPARLGTLQIGEQGSVAFSGDYANSGKTIEQNQSTGAWTFGGSINGGAFVASDGITPILDNAQLDGVQFTGGAEVRGWVHMSNGQLTLNNTLKLETRSTLTLDQPVTGTGTIQFDPQGSVNLRLQVPEQTLDEGIKLQVTGEHHLVEFKQSLTTRGQIALAPDSAIEIYSNDFTPSQFRSESEISIGEGAALTVGTDFVNVGSISLNQGLLTSYQRRGDDPSTFENTATSVIEGDGVIRLRDSLENHGTLGPGELLIQSDIVHHPGATLRVDIGGQTPETYDSFLITAGLELSGGGLELSLVDDFVPSVGDEFSIIYANSITGQFADENIMLGDILFEIIYGPDTISLRASQDALAVPEPLSKIPLWIAFSFLVVMARNRREPS